MKKAAVTSGVFCLMISAIIWFLADAVGLWFAAKLSTMTGVVENYLTIYC